MASAANAAQQQQQQQAVALAARPASKDSLRCDSVDSDVYLEINSSPEPLRLLNRFRELCRIFRVNRANGFVCKTLLKHAWAEIHNQLTVIRNRRKVLERRALLQQQRAAAHPANRGSANNNNNPNNFSSKQQQQQQGPKRARVIAPGEAGNNQNLNFNNNNNNNAFDDEAEEDEFGCSGEENGAAVVPFTITGEPPTSSAARARLDQEMLLEQQRQQQLNSPNSMGTDQAGLPTYLPYAWRDSFCTVDLSRTYLGPRGIVAVCALVSEMPWVTELDLSNAAWFVTDERPNFCPTGEEVLRAAVILLSAHPSLEILRLDGNMFTTASYVWLLELCKRSASHPLRVISLENTLLEPFQTEHVAGVLARNAARRAHLNSTIDARISYVDSYTKQSSATNTIGNNNNNNNNNKSTTASAAAATPSSSFGAADTRGGKITSPTSSPVKDAATVTGTTAAKQVLQSGATTHRRGWNFLVSYVSAHPDCLRWSVLVARELSVSVASSTAGSLGQLVPSATASQSPTTTSLSPGKSSSSNTNNNNKKSMPADKEHRSSSSGGSANKKSSKDKDKDNNNSGRPLSPRHTIISAQSQKSIPHPSQESLVYVMSGLSPNVLPSGAARDAVIAHPFTAETCRFQLSPELQAALESVMKCNPLLSQLDDAGRLELMQRGRIVKRTSRSVVMDTGDPVDFLYAVLHGGLEIRGRPQVATGVLSPNTAAPSFSNLLATNNKNNSNNDSDGNVTGAASSNVVRGNNNTTNNRENLQQYFATPTIYPAGAVVGGEELIAPHIARNERRVASFVTTPCCVLPPVLCRRALIRQSISIDPAKADAVFSHLPIVDACYDNEKLLARANQELEHATSLTGGQRNRGQQDLTDSAIFGPTTTNKTLSSSIMNSGASKHNHSGGGDVNNTNNNNNNNNNNSRLISLSSTADVYRGEKMVTVDDNDEDAALEMGVGDGSAESNAIRLERLRQLYGVQSGLALRKIEQDTHAARVYNSHEMRHEIEQKQQQQKHVGDDFKNDHDSLTVLLLIPRDAFVNRLVSQVREQRRQWASFLDSLPALVSLPSAFKLALSDCIRRRQFTQGEIVAAGFPLLDLLFVVVEGQASIYYQRSEVKRLGRGDIFACHPKTDVSRVSIVVTSVGASAAAGKAISGSGSSLYTARPSISAANAGGSVSSLVLGVISPTFAATLPIGLQRFLMRLRRVYSLAADPHVTQPDGS